jgi:hypothetical protein
MHRKSCADEDRCNPCFRLPGRIGTAQPKAHRRYRAVVAANEGADVLDNGRHGMSGAEMEGVRQEREQTALQRPAAAQHRPFSFRQAGFTRRIVGGSFRLRAPVYSGQFL